MSKLQINMSQSELLMAIRCILNCQNDDIIANIMELKERYYNDEAIKCALFEAGYESAKEDLKTDDYVQSLIERDTPAKLINGKCQTCGKEPCTDGDFCDYCGKRIDWSEELKNLHESHD